MPKRKRPGKKLPEVVIVTKTIVPTKETLFPEKVKRANALLKNAKLMNSSD